MLDYESPRLADPVVEVGDGTSSCRRCGKAERLRRPLHLHRRSLSRPSRAMNSFPRRPRQHLGRSPECREMAEKVHQSLREIYGKCQPGSRYTARDGRLRYPAGEIEAQQTPQASNSAISSHGELPTPNQANDSAT